MENKDNQNEPLLEEDEGKKKKEYRDSHNAPLLKDFEGIHGFIRDIALRGYRDRGEYSHIAIKEKNYDGLLMKMRFALGEAGGQKPEVLKVQKADGKKKYYLLNQPMKWQDNPLARVWRCAIPDRTDLFFYINILGGIDSVNGKTIGELAKLLNDKCRMMDEGEADELQEEKKIRSATRRRLEEMEKQMLIRSKFEKGKKGKVYYLEKPIWNKEFSKGELQEIHDYLEFLKNVMPFELPYYLLQKNLELYMAINDIEFEKDEDKKLFLFRNRNMINVLDSEKIYIFLRGLKSKERLTIEYTEKNTELHRLKRGEKENDVTTSFEYEPREVTVEKIRYVRRTGEMFFWLADAVFDNPERRYTSNSTGERVQFYSKKKPEALKNIFNVFHSYYFDRMIYLCNQKDDGWTRAELEQALFGENIDAHLSKELLSKDGDYWLFPYDEEEKKYYKSVDKIELVSTIVHREALKSFEEIPFTEAFLHPDTIKKIKTQMQDFESSWSIKDIEKCFDRGKPSTMDEIELPSYQKMRDLLKAVGNKRIVTDVQGKSFAPLKVQYSIRNENFKLFVYDPEQEMCKRLSLEEIDFTKLGGKLVSEKEFIDEKIVEAGMQNLDKMRKKLNVKLTASVKAVNNDNLLTRELFMMLSSYEHIVQYSEDGGEFDIEITYWPDDEEELLKDLKECSGGFYKQICKDGTILKI